VVCDRCGRQSEHVHFSDYAKQWLCYLCYSRLPQAQSVAQARPFKSPPRREPTRYERFVDSTCEKIEQRTGHPVFTLGVDSVAAYCPACRRGTLTLTFVQGTPNKARVRSRGAVEPGHCSEGCTEYEIAESLQ
jgi:hypothetical protein